MYWYLFMVLITLVGSAVHVTLVAGHWCIRFETIVLFTHDTRGVTLMIFSITEMLQIVFTEIVGAKRSSNARDGVILIIIHQIHVDTRSFVGTGTGNELVAQSGADHHHANSEHFFKRLYIVQTRRSIHGNSRQLTNGYR